MKLYKCDVCGKITHSDDTMARKSERNTFSLGLYLGMFSNIDVCSSCLSVGHKMDFESMALNAWREAVNENGSSNILS